MRCQVGTCSASPEANKDLTDNRSSSHFLSGIGVSTANDKHFVCLALTGSETVYGSEIAYQRKRSFEEALVDVTSLDLHSKVSNESKHSSYGIALDP